MRPLFGSAPVLILSVVIAICVFFLLDQKLPNFIALDCPNDVNGKETLRGRIIDTKWRVYVMLRPLGVQGTFVNPAPPPGKDGTWYATIHFGGGEGERFEVYALALSPDKDSFLNLGVPPEPDWLEKNARYRTSICVVTKRQL